MNLTIIYKRLTDRGNRDSLTLSNVESIRHVKADVLETKTFGNESVLQRDVFEFRADGHSWPNYDGPAPDETDTHPDEEYAGEGDAGRGAVQTTGEHLAKRNGPRTIDLTPTPDGYEQIAKRFISDLIYSKTKRANQANAAHILYSLVETAVYLASLPDGPQRVARLLTSIKTDN